MAETAAAGAAERAADLALLEAAKQRDREDAARDRARKAADAANACMLR